MFPVYPPGGHPASWTTKEIDNAWRDIHFAIATELPALETRITNAFDFGMLTTFDADTLRSALAARRRALTPTVTRSAT